jgi:hypothetical protein
MGQCFAFGEMRLRKGIAAIARRQVRLPLGLTTGLGNSREVLLSRALHALAPNFFDRFEIAGAFHFCTELVFKGPMNLFFLPRTARLQAQRSAAKRK